MSWSLPPTLARVKPAEAKTIVAETHMPETIRGYLNAGIDGIVLRRGEDQIISITGHGHLCDGPSSYEVTTATIEVKPVED